MAQSPPPSPGTLADIAEEEEEREMLARMEARCRQAKLALKQTKLPGSRAAPAPAPIEQFEPTMEEQPMVLPSYRAGVVQVDPRPTV